METFIDIIKMIETGNLETFLGGMETAVGDVRPAVFQKP